MVLEQCITLSAMPAGQPGEAATSHDPTKKIARQSRYTRRRPAISDTFPMNVMLIAYETKYPVTTHPATSSFWISMVKRSDHLRQHRGDDGEIERADEHGRQTSARISPGYCRARDIQACGLGVGGELRRRNVDRFIRAEELDEPAVALRLGDVDPRRVRRLLVGPAIDGIHHIRFERGPDERIQFLAAHLALQMKRFPFWTVSRSTTAPFARGPQNLRDAGPGKQHHAIEIRVRGALPNCRVSGFD
jgi:hypothetical protein